MLPNESLQEKIKRIKDKIAECRDYISSDLCRRCTETYNQMHKLEEELRVLENECLG